MNEQVDTLFLGDSIELLTSLPDDSVDFVITSPPYADNRKSTYQGVPMDQYVEWFTPYTAEILRLLKPDGSFILNIKERAENGERNTYVIELILEMRRQGWYWIEEYIWHKKNSYPGKWQNRFRGRLGALSSLRQGEEVPDVPRRSNGPGWGLGRL